jgi:hypothetical protein
LEHGLLVFPVMAAHRRLGSSATGDLPADAHPFRPLGVPNRRDNGWAIGKNHRRRRNPRLDAFKRVKGRKRHILVDTLGLPIANRAEAADISDRRAAALLTGGLKAIFPAIPPASPMPGMRAKSSPAPWRSSKVGSCTSSSGINAPSRSPV